MGATQTQTLGKDIFKLQQWVQIPLHTYTNNNDPYYSSNFTVLSHKTRRNIQLQRYNLFFNSPSEYRSYYESFEWRRSMPSIVSAKFMNEINRKDLCATFYSSVIYIERIPIRLYEITDVPLGEGIYMMRCALEGFGQIFQKTGYFQIQSELICINLDGKVKVWANKNLSKNYPQFSSINHNKTQSQFIHKIISVIEDSIDHDGSWKFSQFLSKTHQYVKFENVFGFLAEYTKMQHITVSKAMNTILCLFRQTNKTHQSEPTYHSCLQNNKNKKSLSQLSSDNDQSFKKNNHQCSRAINSIYHPNLQIHSDRKEPNTYKQFPTRRKCTNSHIKQINYTKPNKIQNINHHQFKKVHHNFSRDNFKIYSSKTNTTPISFLYKDSGLYSPQNLSKPILMQQCFTKTPNRLQSFSIPTKRHQQLQSNYKVIKNSEINKLNDIIDYKEQKNKQQIVETKQKIEIQQPNNLKQKFTNNQNLFRNNDQQFQSKIRVSQKIVDSLNKYYASKNTFLIDPEIIKDLQVYTE